MTAPVRENLSGLDLRAEIERLRKERNAVILAHYYQKPEIQDLADFVGDSLELSRKAADTDADVIAFCGVKFMAETAKILSPEKIVILPDMDAGCSLEDSCPPEQFARFRAAHPDHIALTYINCSAAVKALSDIIVTSSSAETIISQIPEDQPIIFGPDPDEDTQELFEDCASNPAMYYYAPTNADIAKAFRAIGGQLANLMIVE